MRFSTLLILSSCILLTACTTSLQPKKGAETLVQAHDQLEEQNYEDARALFQQTLENSEDRVIQAESFHGLSLVAREQGHYRQHISYLEQASTIDPEKYKDDLANAYWRYGSAKQKSLAKKIFVELSGSSSSANKYLAQTAYENGKVDMARAYYRTQRDLVTAKYREQRDPNGELALELGRLNYLYDGVEKNCPAAEKWYSQAIEKGRVDAAYELAMLWQGCEGSQRPAEDVFALMLQAAEKGHTKAIRSVADAYMNGKGVPASQSSAMIWYKKLGLDAGRKEMEKIADSLMFSSNGSVHNIERAVQCYEMAARKGSPKGAVIAGAYDKNVASFPEEALLEEAEKIEKKYGNSHEQVVWKIYSALADKGVADAIFWKARAYELGEYVEKDPAQSQIWYEKAAKSDSPEAYLRSARLYMLESDDPDAPEKAFNAYKKAAELGSGEGQYQTGLMYARGIGTEKDADKARAWLQKAEKNGYALATQTLQSFLEE
ncbi:MAG: SEL1-like repeat protein [Rhodospirillales bacterium]|nr:SEL1-like repeat protein [Rhodospirillales bacterium]